MPSFLHPEFKNSSLCTISVSKIIHEIALKFQLTIYKVHPKMCIARVSIRILPLRRD